MQLLEAKRQAEKQGGFVRRAGMPMGGGMIDVSYGYWTHNCDCTLYWDDATAEDWIACDAHGNPLASEPVSRKPRRGDIVTWTPKDGHARPWMNCLVTRVWNDSWATIEGDSGGYHAGAPFDELTVQATPEELAWRRAFDHAQAAQVRQDEARAESAEADARSGLFTGAPVIVTDEDPAEYVAGLRGCDGDEPTGAVHRELVAVDMTKPTSDEWEQAVNDGLAEGDKLCDEDKREAWNSGVRAGMVGIRRRARELAAARKGGDA